MGEKRAGVILAFIVAVAVAACRTSREPPNDRFLLGCWKLEHERFSVRRETPVDPGQTTLPTLLQFDTARGKSFFDRPAGHRVRAVGLDSASTDYRSGYYHLTGRGKVQVVWTNGFTGMTLDLRGDSVWLHGKASAWTDYQGEEIAGVQLQRTSCPPNSR